MTPFDRCFDLLIGHEGGYSRDPQDRGNWTGGAVNRGVLKGTKFGISAAAYPDVDIANLLLHEAKAIYKRDYWDRIQGDLLPPAIALVTFDAAVNAGPAGAGKFLQIAVGVRPDGIVGPATLAAVEARQQAALLVECLARRNEYNRTAPTAHIHGLGWSRRLFTLHQQALALLVEEG